MYGQNLGVRPDASGRPIFTKFCMRVDVPDIFSWFFKAIINTTVHLQPKRYSFMGVTFAFFRGKCHLSMVGLRCHCRIKHNSLTSLHFPVGQLNPLPMPTGAHLWKELHSWLCIRVLTSFAGVALWHPQPCVPTNWLQCRPTALYSICLMYIRITLHRSTPTNKLLYSDYKAFLFITRNLYLSHQNHATHAYTCTRCL